MFCCQIQIILAPFLDEYSCIEDRVDLLKEFDEMWLKGECIELWGYEQRMTISSIRVSFLKCYCKEILKFT